MSRLLLLSNSTNHGCSYLEHALEEIGSFLGDVDGVVFAPYALADHDGYAAAAAQAFGTIGRAVRSLHTAADPVSAVRAAPAVFVGGGNTFRLLTRLHALGLVDALVEAVAAGTLYMGASAGTNVACPTIRTTNDMPIVEPPTFTSVGLVDFQINPHYLDTPPDARHMGETREQRIAEFHEENDVPVVGLREGSWLRVEQGEVRLRGKTGCRLFRRGAEPQEVPVGRDLAPLLV